MSNNKPNIYKDFFLSFFIFVSLSFVLFCVSFVIYAKFTDINMKEEYNKNIIEEKRQKE